MIQQPLPPGSLVTAGANPLVDASLIGRYRRIRASSGGGFLFSRLVSDRVGTVIAALAEPLNVHPSVLTLGNLVLGVAGSALVVLGDGAKAISVMGLAGLILWQLAYALDCADGQLARATGKVTPSGARLDTCVDFAVQTSVLVAVASVVEHWSHPAIALVVVLVGTWYVNFIGYLHDRIDAKAVPSLLPSRSALVSVIKLSRDYGLVILVVGAWLTFAPTTLLIPVLCITAVNVLTMAGYITQAALISIRSTAETQSGGTGESPR
jgi:phosphatidylglycerophosphate synthase